MPDSTCLWASQTAHGCIGNGMGAANAACEPQMRDSIGVVSMQQRLADDCLAHVQAPAAVAESLRIHCLHFPILVVAHLGSGLQDFYPAKDVQQNVRWTIDQPSESIALCLCMCGVQNNSLHSLCTTWQHSYFYDPNLPRQDGPLAL